MTKQAKIQPQNERQPQPRPMQLRSNTPLHPEPTQVIPSIKKSSLIGDKQLDEHKIIREFQAKRKLLMRILKQKQKQKALSIANFDSFQVKEGILDFGLSDSQPQDSPITHQETFSGQPCQESGAPSGIGNQKQVSGLAQCSTVKVDAAIQTEKTTKRWQEPNKETIKSIPMAQKKISKQRGKRRLKKPKRTIEEIEKLKNQINQLFVPKQSKKQSFSKENSQNISIQSSFSRDTDEKYMSQVVILIQKLNADIETYYKGKHLKKVILGQYKHNYNQRINSKQKHTISHSSKKSFFSNGSIDSDSQKIDQNRLRMEKNALNQDPKQIKTSEKKHHLSNAEGDNSNSYKKSQRKQSLNKRLLNERFQILDQESQQALDLKESFKDNNNIKHQQKSRKNRLDKTQSDYFYFSDSEPINFEDESDTESSYDPSKAWIKEFNIQVEVIYKKFPRLRKYQLSQKISNFENKNIQFDEIQKHCDSKTKTIQKSAIKLPTKKSFGKKFKDAAKQKRFSGTKQKKVRTQKAKKQMKKNPKLKEIEIGPQQEEQFCKSFDHRSHKASKLMESQFSIDPKDNRVYNQFYDVLQNEKNKSHEFYFSSDAENVLNDQTQGKKSAIIENRGKQQCKSMSKSLVFQSQEIEGEKLRILPRSIENSFIRSDESKDYFNLSVDNPLLKF